MTDQSRRRFLRSTTTLAGAALLAPSLQGLVACAGAAAASRSSGRPSTTPRQARPGSGGYGSLRSAGRSHSTRSRNTPKSHSDS